MILALGTVPITAGAVDMMFFAAAIALIDGNAILSGTIFDDGIDGLFVLDRHIGIAGKIFRAEGAEDLGNSAHAHISCMTYDNIFVERLWRSVKYEEIYLHQYLAVAEALKRLKQYFMFYNTERIHESLGYKTPYEIYFKELLKQQS